jgi:hypothetical protein
MVDSTLEPRVFKSICVFAGSFLGRHSSYKTIAEGKHFLYPNDYDYVIGEIG